MQGMKSHVGPFQRCLILRQWNPSLDNPIGIIQMYPSWGDSSDEAVNLAPTSGETHPLVSGDQAEIPKVLAKLWRP